MKEICRVWGPTLVKAAAQIVVYFAAMWTYAEQRGLGDGFVQGVRDLVGLPLDLLRSLATPGGDR